MGFADFHGNQALVTRLRQMLARKRFPHAVILSGPPGAGKYTLAQMLAKSMNCEQTPAGPLPDFCGRCPSCMRIAAADDLEARFAEAVEAREALREADKRETRILVQTHEDVLVIPPDPPQRMIKVDQVRHVIRSLHQRPAGGRRRVYIFSDAPFLKEAANSLLKALEEPPATATLFLLAANPGALLATIRSRCVEFRLAPLPAAEVEQALVKLRPAWKPAQRALAARLAEGAVGRAAAFDLEAYSAARSDALTLLAAVRSDHSALFRATESYRAGAEGREKTERLLRTLYALLEDVLHLQAGTAELVRNRDLVAELQKLAGAVDFDWVAAATRHLGEVEAGMRRNLLRSLSLDAFAVALERD
jgi:DNA polymerase-3 subunit delta'